MINDMQALEKKNSTMDLTNLMLRRNRTLQKVVYPYKWIATEIYCYKALLVAKGFTQT